MRTLDWPIVGITGPMGGGKSTAAAYLKDHYGYEPFSLSSIIRKRAEIEGLPQDRDNLRGLGNLIRIESGPWVLAQTSYEIARNARNVVPGTKFVLEGVRNPYELTYLQKRAVPILGVYAWLDDAHDRVRERSRDGDPVKLADFRISWENDWGESAITDETSVDTCIKYADFRIINNGDLSVLRSRLDDAMKSPYRPLLEGQYLPLRMRK